MESSAGRAAALESKFAFQLPEADFGLVNRRQTVRFAAKQNSYAPGATAEIEIQSQGGFIDPQESYFTAEIEVTRTSGGVFNDTSSPEGKARSAAVTFQLKYGVEGMIRRMRVLSYNGTALEDIQDYDVITALHDNVVDLKKCDPAEYESSGRPPCRDVSDLEVGSLPYIDITGAVDYITGVQASTADMELGTTDDLPVGYARRFRHYSEAFEQTGGKPVAWKCRASGLFGGKRVIPLPQLGSVNVEFTLAQAHECFQAMQMVMFPNGGAADDSQYAETDDAKQEADGKEVSTNTWATDTTWQQFHPAIMEYQGRRSDYYPDTSRDFNGAISYSVKNLAFVASLVHPSQAMSEAVAQAVAKEGLPLFFDTFYTYAETLTVATAGAPHLPKSSFEISKSAANARSVVTAFRSIQPTSQSLVTDRWRFLDPGVSGYQYRIGTSFEPQFVPSTVAVMYREALKAIPGHVKEKMGVPIQRYSWQNNERCWGATRGVGAVGPTRRNFRGVQNFSNVTSKNSLVSNEEIPDKFFLGANLESTPGVVLSGQSLNSGNTLVLELQTQNSAHSPGWQGGSTEAADAQSVAVTHMLRYTRLLLVMPNRNVVIKE